MEAHVYLKIDIGGKVLSTLSHLSIVQRHDYHHSFELRIPSDDLVGESDQNSIAKSKDYIGKPVKIEVKSASEKEQLNQFNGIITGISLARYAGSASDVILKGFSPTILFDDGINCRSFSEKTISQIINAITSPYPKNDVKIKSSPSPDKKIDFIVQYKETNYQFLSRIAEEYGQWFYYNGKEAVFGKLESEETVDLEFGNDLLNFDLGVKVSPVKFTSLAYDYINNKPLEAQSSSVQVSGLNDLGKHAMDVSESLYNQDVPYYSKYNALTQSDLKDFVTFKKSEIAGNLVVLSGVTENARLKIGCKINVKARVGSETTEDYGSYIVTSVSHFTDSMGVYQNRFEAIPSTITVPPLNPNVKSPVCETQSAVVKKNNDSDGMGRVKVQFFWQKSPDMTPWIRIVNHHAGKNKGFQFIPEENDEVLVGFENGNPGRPYVLGSVYQGKAKHEDRKDDDNYIKTIRTVSGNEIKFLDKKGEEEILIQNKEGQNEIRLQLKDNGKIFIKSKNKMELRAKEILIEAENKLEMKSKTTRVSGKDKITVDTEKDCEIKSMDTKLETQKNVTIKAGAKAELKATAGLDVDGGPKTSIKSAAMMEINGGGQATLKAGIVMIN